MYRSLEQFIVNTPKCIYGFGSTYKDHFFLSSRPVRYVHVISVFSTSWRDLQPGLFQIIPAGRHARGWKLRERTGPGATTKKMSLVRRAKAVYALWGIYYELLEKSIHSKQDLLDCRDPARTQDYYAYYELDRLLRTLR